MSVWFALSTGLVWFESLLKVSRWHLPECRNLALPAGMSASTAVRIRYGVPGALTPGSKNDEGIRSHFPQNLSGGKDGDAIQEEIEMLQPSATYLLAMLIVCTLAVLIRWAFDAIVADLDAGQSRPADLEIPVQRRTKESQVRRRVPSDTSAS
jgi:hypothetical protein